MARQTFDATELIAGFPLARIKQALFWIGLERDRDDIEIIADGLRCGRPQAERVLEVLERRGFVTRASKKNRWEQTPLGRELSFCWHPPRRLEPVIQREEETNACNEIFDAVACSIFRGSDDGDAFEEADLEVGVFVEYESERVIEILVSKPDDYEHRDGSSTVETSIYIGLAEAKRFIRAFETAIERGEAEIARRAAIPVRERTGGRGRSSGGQ